MNDISQEESLMEKVRKNKQLKANVKKRRLDIFERSIGSLYDQLDSLDKNKE